jgi:hypothetical protein
MSERSDLEQNILKWEADLATIEQRKSSETRQAAECAERASALAFEAVAGNKKALSEQSALDIKKGEHLRMVDNLEKTAAKLRRDIAAGKIQLEHLLGSEEVAELIDEVADLPSLSRELSEALAVPVAKFGAFEKRITAGCKKAFPVLGNRDRIARLEKALQQSLHQAIRVELNRQFGAVGIHIFATRFEEKDFEAVMRPPLEHLRQALEMKLHTNSGTPIAGRAMFVAKTNIGGLFGLTIATGEKMSLPLDDPTVRDMIARGALEQISDEKAVSA